MSDPDSRSKDAPGTFLSIDVSGPIGPLLEEEAPDTSAADETYRRRLQHILSEGDKASTSETIPALLELGAKRLGVENGHLAEVDPAEGAHRIVETSGPHPVIEKGATADLASTYCRKLLAGREALAVQDASKEGWEGDPAYETYGLEAYVGAKIVVEEDLYGTVCFVGSEPRTGPLGEPEESFLELVTKAISRELRRRWRAEQGRRTRARLEALFEGSPDMIHVHDLEGNLLEPNPRLLERTGYEEAELAEMKMWDLDESLEAGEAQDLWEEMEPGERKTWEGRYRRKDGTTFPVEIHLRRLPAEGKGRFMAVSRDVAERKRRERKVQRLRTKYEGLLEGAPDPIFVADAEGRVQEANEAAASLIGTAREHLEGRPVIDLHPAGETAKYEALFRRHLEEDRGTETIGQFEDGSQLYLLREQGERVPVEASVRRVELRGEPHVVGIFRDITDRLRRERQFERLSDLFGKAEELADIGAWEYDPQADWLWWTDQVHEIYGLPKDVEPTTEKAIEAFHPEDRPVIKEAFERALEEGVPYDVEVRLETPDGEPRWVRAHGDTETKEGETTRVYGTIQDITGRKRREEALREAKEEAEEMEELFRSVMDNAPVMIDIIGEDGRVEMINDHFEKVLGFSQEEVETQKEGWLWEKFYPDPSRRQEVLESIRKAPDSWLDFRPRAKGGRRVDSTWSNVKLSDGRRLGLGIDITDRKRRERELGKTNATLEAILKNLPMGVLAEDASRQVLVANERLCEIFDLPVGPAELEGRGGAEAARDLAGRFAKPEEFSRRIEEILSERDPVFGEELRLEDGRVLERDFVPYEIPGGTAGLWVYQNITEQKRREEDLLDAKKEAEKASRLKSAMLANMNHEIRTPLTSVTGFADIMREELGGQMGTFAEQIHKSGERLMRTLDSVLQLSKLEAGISGLDREEVDLARLTRETAELLRPSAKQKDIALKTELPGGPVVGEWNEGALNRIAENLIENAIKFTPEGGTVTVRLREEREEAILEVEDTGIGISEEALPEIFEAFQQESEGLGREFEGSGLGLSIVKRLANAHGGSVRVESEKGEGSCFTVRLPKT